MSLDYRGCQRSSLGERLLRTLHEIGPGTASRLADGGVQVGADIEEMAEMKHKLGKSEDHSSTEVFEDINKKLSSLLGLVQCTLRSPQTPGRGEASR